jgi:hypothetical protein
VIHDDDGDPVAGRTDTPEGVRLVAAGDPDRYSGKANAIAAGMEAACHDRLILTDDDFHHPPDWLATLTADYDRYGPVSEVPYFVGRDPLAVLVEPMLASTASLGIYLGNRIWDGAVVFERDDINERAYMEELRRSVSDDALLMEYLQTARQTPLVPVGGTVRELVERQVRWTKIIRQHFPGAIAGIGFALVLVLTGAVLFPFHAAVVLTAFHLAVNEVLGVHRWTALLAYPAVFLYVPLFRTPSPAAPSSRIVDATAGCRSSTWRLSSNVDGDNPSHWTMTECALNFCWRARFSWEIKLSDRAAFARYILYGFSIR